MKKTLLLLSIIGLASGGFSQITVEHTDLVTAGESIVQAYDSLPGASIFSGNAGANQVWDFSSLNEHDSDTINFVPPSWTPFAANFPTATMAIQLASDDSVWSYLENTTSELIILGIGTIENGQSMTLDINRTLLEFPLNYQDNYTSTTSNDTTVYIGQFGVDSARYLSTEIIQSSVDAWGDVTIPNGTFPCLRINQTTYSSDSVWTYQFGIWLPQQTDFDTSTTFMFWSDDPRGKFPIAEFDLDEFGDVEEVTYLLESPFATINEIEAPAIKAFPNPTSETINFNLGESGLYINIYNMQGALVKTNQNRSSFATIGVDDLEMGNYIVLVKDNNGRVTAKSQFIKL